MSFNKKNEQFSYLDLVEKKKKGPKAEFSKDQGIPGNFFCKNDVFLLSFRGKWERGPIENAGAKKRLQSVQKYDRISAAQSL